MSARKIHSEGPARIIRADGKVEITVKDNGIGILNIYAIKSFNFFSTKPTGQGMG